MDAGELGSRNLCVTWSEVPPGAQQRPHAHADCEQVYVVVEGSGRMTVAGDEQQIRRGDLIFVSPGSEHSVVNDSDETLVYITAASPPISIDELYRTQLAPEVDDFLDDEA